jgi:hypothetical protein
LNTNIDIHYDNEILLTFCFDESLVVWGNIDNVNNIIFHYNIFLHKNLNQSSKLSYSKKNQNGVAKGGAHNRECKKGVLGSDTGIMPCLCPSGFLSCCLYAYISVQ